MRKLHNIFYLTHRHKLVNCRTSNCRNVNCRFLELLLSAVLLLTMTGCYHHNDDYQRFYSFNYNFVVSSDSVELYREQPEEIINKLPTETFSIRKNSRLVVADFRTIPADTEDSVWVQVATETSEFGWIHERELLENVVPDDPISQFISVFSDIHIMVSLIVLGIILIAYMLRKLDKRNAHIVHFNDIDSPYPMLLAIVVSAAATFYASIQMFAPTAWQQFYYDPTLNPFSVSPLLSVFLCSVWAMLIIALAAADDTLHILPLGEAVTYLLGLIGVCAVNYLIFSITTLYYIGYLLLILYIAAALWLWRRRSSPLI